MPPPAHVIEALVESAREQTARVHGYAPFSGLPALRSALADRYAEHYGVELDPEREVAVVPGTKSALVELVLCLAERGDTVLLPIPTTRTTRPVSRSPAPSSDCCRSIPSAATRRASTSPRARTSRPSFSTTRRIRRPPPFATASFADAIAFGRETGAAIIHDFAYGDLVFVTSPEF